MANMNSSSTLDLDVHFIFIFLSLFIFPSPYFLLSLNFLHNMPVILHSLTSFMYSESHMFWESHFIPCSTIVSRRCEPVHNRRWWSCMDYALLSRGQCRALPFPYCPIWIEIGYNEHTHTHTPVYWLIAEIIEKLPSDLNPPTKCVWKKYIVTLTSITIWGPIMLPVWLVHLINQVYQFYIPLLVLFWINVSVHTCLLNVFFVVCIGLL